MKALETEERVRGVLSARITFAERQFFIKILVYNEQETVSQPQRRPLQIHYAPIIIFAVNNRR